MTPNSDFKVRPFFDAEYLQNGCRYRDMAIVTIEGERVPKLSNGTTFNDTE